MIVLHSSPVQSGAAVTLALLQSFSEALTSGGLQAPLQSRLAAAAFFRSSRAPEGTFNFPASGTFGRNKVGPQVGVTRPLEAV